MIGYRSEWPALAGAALLQNRLEIAGGVLPWTVGAWPPPSRFSHPVNQSMIIFRGVTNKEVCDP
jgi:hypothetical protein